MSEPLAEGIVSFIENEADQFSNALSDLHVDILQNASCSELGVDVCDLEDRLFHLREKCLNNSINFKMTRPTGSLSEVGDRELATSGSTRDNKSPLLLNKYACPAEADPFKTCENVASTQASCSAQFSGMHDHMTIPSSAPYNLPNSKEHLAASALLDIRRFGIDQLNQPHTSSESALPKPSLNEKSARMALPSIATSGFPQNHPDPASTLNASAPDFYVQSSDRNNLTNPRLITNHSRAQPPGPRLTLDCFNGELLKYYGFKMRFKKYVENVYPDWEDRLAFLESLCKGEAHNVISGLVCLPNSRDAYIKAWDRLDKRFGDTHRLMSQLRQELVYGPPVKEGDVVGLRALGDKMYHCEASFEGYGKSWVLNSQELMHSLFERLPYKLKCQFVQMTHEGNGTSFKELRELVERAAAEASSEFGMLLHKTKKNKIPPPKISQSG